MRTLLVAAGIALVGGLARGSGMSPLKGAEARPQGH